MTTRDAQQRFYVDVSKIRAALERIAEALEEKADAAANERWRRTGEGTIKED